jgi:tetratricopeptide (TPR) repeat protein
MTYLNWKKILFLLLIPFTLLGQAQKKELTKLPYNVLYDLYFDNYKNQSKQLEFAKAYMTKANADNSPIKKANGYYLFSILSESNKAIRYLDSAIAYSTNKNDIKFPAYAYSKKGYVLEKQFRYKEAIDNFILAEKFSYKNNVDFYYNVKFSIAVLRSEELGEVNEALDLYKECFTYYKNKEIRGSHKFYGD